MPGSPTAERPIEIRAVLKAQYRASLQMLQQAIEQCPDALWLSADGHDAPYWRLAFHALFFTHFYLQKDHHSMTRWPKHRGQLQDLSGPPAAANDVYTKAELLEYLGFCREILDRCIGAMDLTSPDCGFPWYTQGKLEHQINNIRHLQHHTAQLGDRLRSATKRGLDWTLKPV
jgi:hypothetical protein